MTTPTVRPATSRKSHTPRGLEPAQTTSSAGLLPEAGVVVLVAVLRGRARVELCHQYLPHALRFFPAGLRLHTWHLL